MGIVSHSEHPAIVPKPHRVKKWPLHKGQDASHSMLTFPYNYLKQI